MLYWTVLSRHPPTLLDMSIIGLGYDIFIIGASQRHFNVVLHSVIIIPTAQRRCWGGGGGGGGILVSLRPSIPHPVSAL